MPRYSWLLLIIGALCACQGSIPLADDMPHEGLAAVAIKGLIITPSGEVKSGSMYINLENGEGEETRIYRLRVLPGETLLYQVEPGVYHLAPSRSRFGAPNRFFEITVNGHSYQTSFPREILREGDIVAKSGRVLSLGILEAKISEPLPRQGPILEMSNDNEIATKRAIIQELIHKMMDPAADPELRDSAISWLHALQQSLMELAAQPQTPLDQVAP